MTKVVFQSAAYWLTDQFWEDVRTAGQSPRLVECRGDTMTSRPLGRTELASRFAKDRAAGWVHSAHKSVSVFAASLPPGDRSRLLRVYAEAVQTGLKVIAQRMTARTGAQGKVRLPVEPAFVVVIHIEAKGGRPQFHAHIGWPERVQVVGQPKTFAAHTRELYHLRQLFAAVVNHEFGRGLRAEFGVRVQKAGRDGRVVLPDVPKELCRRSSVRKQQVAEYLRQNGLPDTPLARQFGAFATRRQNPDPQIGRRAFHADRVRLGFTPSQVTDRVSKRPAPQPGDRRRVLRAANRLSREKGVWSERDLTARAIREAPLTQPLDRIRQAVGRVLESPRRHRLVASENRQGQPVWTSAAAARVWRRLARRVERVVGAEKEVKRATKPLKGRPSPGQKQGHRRAGLEKPKAPVTDDGRSDDRPNGQSRRTRPDFQAGMNKGHNRADRSESAADAVLRAHRVIGTMGALGKALVERAVELYRLLSRPVLVFDGGLSRRRSSSVAAVARDLRPTPWLRSHAIALRAMVRHYGTLDDKLTLGEAVYRQCRRAKRRIPRNALVVVRRVGSAAPDDVRVLLDQANRAKAQVLFEDGSLTRSQLLRAAVEANRSQPQPRPNTPGQNP